MEVSIERLIARVDKDHPGAASFLNSETFVHSRVRAAFTDDDLACDLRRIEHGRRHGVDDVIDGPKTESHGIGVGACQPHRRRIDDRRGDV